MGATDSGQPACQLSPLRNACHGWWQNVHRSGCSQCKLPRQPGDPYATEGPHVSPQKHGCRRSSASQLSRGALRVITAGGKTRIALLVAMQASSPTVRPNEPEEIHTNLPKPTGCRGFSATGVPAIPAHCISRMVANSRGQYFSPSASPF